MQEFTSRNSHTARSAFSAISSKETLHGDMQLDKLQEKDSFGRFRSLSKEYERSPGVKKVLIEGQVRTDNTEMR